MLIFELIILSLLSWCPFYLTNAQFIDLINDELASDKCTENKCQQCEVDQIRCENFNLSSLDLIADASPDIRSIRFSGNRLVSINTTIFSQNMTSLESLDLSDNQIEFINDTSFLNLPVLIRLILDSNRIDPNQLETLKSFTSITSSLRFLSLVNALKRPKIANKPESSLEDIKVHSLLKLTPNLRTLKLTNNSLQVFNVDNTVDFQNLTDQDQNYEDVLCIMPGLEHLYLDYNKLSELKFELSCINQNTGFNLTSLHLESNQFSNIDINLIKALKRMKGKNDRFRVYLSSNPFRCDCQIYEFYKFLVSNESDGLVEDKSLLMCTHHDSINTTYWKRILNARIDRICGFAGGTSQTTTSAGRYTYVFPTRTTTRMSSSTRKEPLHSNHKLIIFMFVSLMISGVIAFILRVFHQNYK